MLLIRYASSSNPLTIHSLHSTQRSSHTQNTKKTKHDRSLLSFLSCGASRIPSCAVSDSPPVHTLSACHITAPPQRLARKHTAERSGGYLNCHLSRVSTHTAPATRMASMLYGHLPQVIGVIGAGQMGSGIAQVRWLGRLRKRGRLLGWLQCARCWRGAGAPSPPAVDNTLLCRQHTVAARAAEGSATHARCTLKQTPPHQLTSTHQHTHNRTTRCVPPRALMCC